MAELDREDLYGGYLDALANALDPHSSYLTQDALDDFQIQMELSLEGIGVALSDRDGYAVVEQIIPGGAADRIAALAPAGPHHRRRPKTARTRSTSSTCRCATSSA